MQMKVIHDIILTKQIKQYQISILKINYCIIIKLLHQK